MEATGNHIIYRDAFQDLGDRHSRSLIYAFEKIKQSPVSEYAKEIVLFGSCARSEARYDSDIDLLLILSEDTDIEKQHSEIIQLRGDVVPPDINLPEVDLKITCGDGWRTSDSCFYTNIRREGKTIWHQ